MRIMSQYRRQRPVCSRTGTLKMEITVSGVANRQLFQTVVLSMIKNTITPPYRRKAIYNCCGYTRFLSVKKNPKIQHTTIM